MKAFAIDDETNISFFDTKAEAAKHIESCDSGAVFTTQDQLATVAANMPTSTLIEIFNSFTGVTEVKKFQSKAAAVSRIWHECQKMAKETVAPITTADDMVRHINVLEERAETPTVDATAAHVEAEGGTATDTTTTRTTDPLDAIGQTLNTDAPKPKRAKPAKVAKAPKAAKEAAPKPEGDAKAPRDGSKTAQVIEMLKQPGGAKLADIMKRFDWQQHTTRSLLSAGGSLTKKHGITVKSEKGADGDRVFSISA
jgi:hypothetical protein